MDSRDVRVAELERELARALARIGPLQEDVQERQHQIAELAEQVAERDQANAALAGLEQRCRKLESELDAREQELAKLNSARTSTRTTNNKAVKVATKQLASYGLSKPRGKRDSLQIIKGVGPALEKQLYELGIFHLRQIAGFSQQDIAWVSERVGRFKDRIERDKWVDQAKSLL